MSKQNYFHNIHCTDLAGMLLSSRQATGLVTGADSWSHDQHDK